MRLCFSLAAFDATFTRRVASASRCSRPTCCAYASSYMTEVRSTSARRTNACLSSPSRRSCWASCSRLRRMRIHLASRRRCKGSSALGLETSVFRHLSNQSADRPCALKPHARLVDPCRALCLGHRRARYFFTISKLFFVLLMCGDDASVIPDLASLSYLRTTLLYPQPPHVHHAPTFIDTPSSLFDLLFTFPPFLLTTFGSNVSDLFDLRYGSNCI